MSPSVFNCMSFRMLQGSMLCANQSDYAKNIADFREALLKLPFAEHVIYEFLYVFQESNIHFMIRGRRHDPTIFYEVAGMAMSETCKCVDVYLDPSLQEQLKRWGMRAQLPHDVVEDYILEMHLRSTALPE